MPRRVNLGHTISAIAARRARWSRCSKICLSGDRRETTIACSTTAVPSQATCSSRHLRHFWTPWATISSINRGALPMIHPLFTQFNEDLGKRLNAGCPADDFATYRATVAKEIAGVAAANGTAEVSKTYGEKVAH